MYITVWAEGLFVPWDWNMMDDFRIWHCISRHSTDTWLFLDVSNSRDEWILRVIEVLDLEDKWSVYTVIISYVGNILPVLDHVDNQILHDKVHYLNRDGTWKPESHRACQDLTANISRWNFYMLVTLDEVFLWFISQILIYSRKPFLKRQHHRHDGYNSTSR